MGKNLLRKSIKIVCPSYKRAGETMTDKIFGKSLTFAVHEFEASEYRKTYPKNEIFVIPDEVQGNMAKVRNYIKDMIDEKYLVMVDDDIKKMGHFETLQRLPIENISHFLEMGFVLAEDSHTILWGTNITDQRNAYHQQTPFSFFSPILGTFCGHINIDKDLRYDERLSLNEDYDYFLQVIRKYRRAIRYNKYFYIADHIKKDGGCKEWRTHKKEVKEARLMESKWGKKIVSYNLERSYNPRVRLC
jgi:hypothetical protein